MLAINDAVKEAWLSPARQLAVRVKVNQSTYGSEEISSLSFDSGSISGEVYQIGSTYMNSVTIVFPAIIETIKADQEVIPELGILVDGVYYYTKLGHFYITEFDRDRNSNRTTIKASDKMIYMEGVYESKLAYPKAYREVALEIANLAGIEINQESFATLGSIKIQEPVGYTYRQAIGLIAQFEGGFASFNRDGELEVRRLRPTEFGVTPASYLLKGLTKNENAYRIGGITVRTGDEEGDVLRVGSTNGSQVELENKVMTQTLLNNIWDLVKTLNYFPYELKWRGCPALEAGDWMYVTDRDGNRYSVPNLSYSLTFNGGLSAESKATTNSSSQATYKYRGTLNQKVDYINSILSANNWNSNYYDPTEPQNPKLGDLWFKEAGDIKTILVYEERDGVLDWYPFVSTETEKEIAEKVEEAVKKAEEAKTAANQSYLDAVAESGRQVEQASDQWDKNLSAVEREMTTGIIDAKAKADQAVSDARNAAQKAENSTTIANQAKVDAAKAITQATDTANRLLSLSAGSGNWLRNSTWNFGQEFWQGFSETRYISDPEPDAPDCHVLNLTSIAGGTAQLSSERIWVEAGQECTLSFDFFYPLGSSDRDNVIAAIRIFDTKTGSSSAASSIWSPYLRQSDVGLTVADAGAWNRHSWTFTVPAGKSGWLSVIPYWGSIDGSSIGRYRRVYLSGGNIPMTWSPSQEDVQVQIDTINGELIYKVSQVMFDDLTGTVNEQGTKITQNQKDIQLKASAASVNALTGKVSSVESTLSTQAGQITALNTKTDGQSTQIGKLQTGYDGLTSTVSQVETNLAGINYENLNLLPDSDVESLSKVTAPYDRYFSDAGNPGVTDLRFIKVFDSPTPSGWVLQATSDGSAPSNAPRGLCWYSSGGRFEMELGQTYTMSCMARCISGGAKLRFQYGINPYPNNYQLVRSDTWERYSWTFVATQGSTRIYMPAGSGDVAGVVQLCGFKLEKGGRATPWALSITEVATVTAISEVKQTITSIQGTVASKAEQSQVTQMAGQITSILSTRRQNLILNSDFRQGTTSWSGTGISTIPINTATETERLNTGFAIQKYIRVTKASLAGTSAYPIQTIKNPGDYKGKKLRFSLSYVTLGGGYTDGSPIQAVARYTVDGVNYYSRFTSRTDNYLDLSSNWKRVDCLVDLTGLTAAQELTDIRISMSFVAARFLTDTQRVAASAFLATEDGNLYDWDFEYPKSQSYSQITQLTDLIDLRVEKDSVISAITLSPETIKITGKRIQLDGDVSMSAAWINKLYADSGFITNLETKTLNAVKANITNIITSDLAANTITSTHLKADSALIDKLFATSALIDRLTSKTAFITNIQALDVNASKITTGTLNAANVNLINVNAGSVTTGILKGITIQAVDFKGENMTLTGAIKLDYSYNESSGVDPRRFNGTWTIQNNYIWMRGTETGVSDSDLTGYFDTYIGGDVLKFRRYTSATSGVLKSRVDIHSSRLTITSTWNADDGFWAGPNGYGNFNNMAINGQHSILSKDGVAVGFYNSGGSTTVGLYAKDFVKQSQLSAKTNISELDQQEALETLLATDILLYQYKSDVGTDEYHASVIIDDVHESPIYRTPYIFTGHDMKGRDDGTVVGYLVQAVKALHEKIKILEDKVA